MNGLLCQIGDREKVAQQYHLEPRQRIFSAGNNDSAMVYGGKLYVWGEAFEDERYLFQTIYL